MSKLEASVVINRPTEEVFAFVTDIEKLPQWMSELVEAKQTSEGPMGVGTTYNVVIELLGRRIESNVEFTEYEPNSKYSTKDTSGPMPMEISTTFKAVEGGTEVTNSAKLEAAGLFKLAEPIFARMAKRQVETDFANLKDLLEARAFGSD